MSHSSLVTYPYLRCDSKGNRCIVANPGLSTEIQSHTELLFVLEQLATPDTVDCIGRRFGLALNDIEQLVELGILADPETLESDRTGRDRPKIGVVTTCRTPGPLLESFLRYYFLIGMNHVFLFFDDPEDDAIPRAHGYENLSVIPVDDALRQQQKLCTLYPELEPHLESEVMARQMLNVETALGWAAERGLDWLIHVDIDELFFTRQGLDCFFSGIPDDVGFVSFYNFEAAPEKLSYDDPYRDVTLFKRNPSVLSLDRQRPYPHAGGKPHFLGYVNGKSAVRVAPGALPSGVHLFKPPTGYPGWLRPPLEPAILHYVYCDFEAFLKKYSVWGEFSDFQWGNPEIPWTDFHKQSRDICRTGDRKRIQEFFERTVLYTDAAKIDDYIKSGMCLRIEGVRQLLTQPGPP